MAEVYDDQIEIAYRAEDVTRIAAEGKKVEIIGIENGFVIGRDAHALEQLDHYYQLGARYMGLTHSGNNDICDSSSALKWSGNFLRVWTEVEKTVKAEQF